MMATAKREPKAERNLDGYGAPLIPWTKVRERLEQGLSQVRDRADLVGIPVGWQRCVQTAGHT